MANGIPRIRMFAGPNGSGKSTMISGLDSRLSKLFLNADNLERDLKINPVLDLQTFDKRIDAKKLVDFLSNSKKTKKDSEGNKVNEPYLSILPTVDGSKIDFQNNSIDSYLAAAILDYIRKELLLLKVSFTFETVMSHKSKIDFLRDAKSAGYRTYLYFVTTEDPDINVDRVRQRVKKGGHAVDETKIRERYSRTMSMLIDAIEVSDRAFLFDNSSNKAANASYICEVTDGETLTFNPDFIGDLPIWFENYVLVHLVPDDPNTID
ncbi:zeta toxin family protein [Acinetobacter sp. ANC 4639]|jgi:predicted ABC-type ATPase